MQAKNARGEHHPCENFDSLQKGGEVYQRKRGGKKKRLAAGKSGIREEEENIRSQKGGRRGHPLLPRIKLLTLMGKR